MWQTGIDAGGKRREKNTQNNTGKEDSASFHIFILGETKPRDGTTSSPTFLPELIYPVKHQPSASSLLVSPPILGRVHWLASWPLLHFCTWAVSLLELHCVCHETARKIFLTSQWILVDKIQQCNTSSTSHKPFQRDAGRSSRRSERKFGRVFFFSIFKLLKYVTVSLLWLLLKKKPAPFPLKKHCYYFMSLNGKSVFLFWIQKSLVP